MGKIINSTFVSIDGVINHMETWHFDYTDDEADQIAAELPGRFTSGVRAQSDPVPVPMYR